MASENLTYAEIAARLGVSPEAARGLTRRLRLPRLRTNDGNKTLVAIDFAEIRHHPTPRLQPPDNQADIATLKERITALEAELCAERQRSGDYRAELCAEQQRSGDYQTDFERERIRADRECERADRERERADRLIELHQADIATLKERIPALEAELCAEQQRSGDYRRDFEREWIRAGRERERADRLIELHQADIATLKERIPALEAELCAEQQRSGDYQTDFERERNRADHERERADHLIEQQDQLVVELEALRTLLEEASGPVAERPWRWWPRRAG
jgi:chromosome segregation ATPase